ncbi:hypothetical protein [Brevibacterium pigmentatum]|uniref:hypothetical protein n=1 Tax=Brevibacterium pigmentatum TaxID=1496080 RepID=UPI001420B4FE|nr:hypothetical protein [Brevibacterium pigmentatum]
MSNNPQRHHQNWNQQNPQGQPNQYYPQQPQTDSFPNDPHAVYGVPSSQPGGVMLTPNGYVITRAIKFKTIANRGWSTLMFVLVALSGIASFIILMVDPYYFWMSLVSTLMLAIGAGVIHMLESIVAELRRLN